MKKRKAFNFLASYASALEQCSAKSRLKLYDSIVKYALTGEQPEGLSKTESALWASFYGTLEPSREGWINASTPGGGYRPKEEKRREEGRKKEEAHQGQLLKVSDL
jgi:hypothetical protein